MSWENELAKKIKERKEISPSFFIGTIIQKTPIFKISTLDGGIIIEEGEKLIETVDFNSWRTTTDEEDLIGKKILLIGGQKFVAISEVV